ncbi:hypothetical protein Q8A67_005328 [Cirrhinus molitorella]|uniref:HD domain-containing protein n=1 Tax=Cirrhinus molitorella TaxID=172907 RepID=A0AA88Q9P2_9TELE|nr:hypothetical protein Q8A67_005328 [Cirrhinus molitorella]
MKIFNDPIHGHIELHPLLVKMIDTPQFQRLRFIKQLGTKYLVYPGATHTRFEHSLGVAHLAGCLLKTLHENQPELNITKQDFLCVQIAALCHDMGHGPFSHLFDGMFIPKVQPGKCLSFLTSHEEASVQMFHCMKRRNGLDKEMKFYGLNLPEDIKFIEELILKGQKDGEWSMKGRTEDKSFLYEIVANKVNGIDVDKWDYLVRDCYYLGIPCGFDHQRLLKSARVCNVNGRKHICFRDKMANDIYDMFHTRYTLYHQAYKHKIVTIIEDKITKALLEAKDTLEISPISPDLSPNHIRQKIENITNSSRKRKMPSSEDEQNAKFIKLTDHIFEKILYSTEDNLKDARKELEDVVMRRLPKCVGETRLQETEENELQTQWNEALDEWNKLHPNLSLYKEDFITEVIQLDYNKNAENPINRVYFYRKRNHTKGSRIKNYEVSSLLPKKFTELVGRVYYTKNSDEELKAAKDCFKWWKSGKVSCAIELYDQQGLKGTKCVITGDCPSLDCCSITEVRSCRVLSGVWGLYEGSDYTEPRYQLQHEQMSVLLFDDIVKSLKAENKDVLKEHGLDDKDVIFIKELNEGAKTSEIHILQCEADNVYDMFRTRYTLHRQAYQHKITNIIDIMLAEALVRADRDLHEGKPEDMLMISEAIMTAEDYSKLTDEIFEQILSSTADNLREARDILNKIIRRKLPKFVGEARLTQKKFSKEKLTETWKAAVKKYKPTDPTVSLNAEDFSVYVVDLDHGMKDKNPIDYVYFYSKRKPNEASAIKDYQLSSFLPKTFNEEVVRVYYKRTDGNEVKDKKKVEEAEKCFKDWCSSKLGLD